MSKSHQQRSEHTNPWLFAMELGFFAGLIWGATRWLMYAMHFTKVVPGFLVEPFFKHDFLVKAEGHLIGYLVFIFFSVIASLLYVLILRKLKGPWPGMVYGVLWWSALFLAGSWMFLQQGPFKLPWNTVITEFCIFLLWGLFIGYTIAIEYTDERTREERISVA
ncbi:YqhR family membrane protein [Paenibacillus wynnii]|uniref:YqhR family membrane protein n=1 Tax=Paenibacillus wynnii TaxID=268407 RepID=UPI00278D6760|nr:YqhR family membrane protein [Paenibacillus wynnii]MDQ0194400.1 putative membrane protein YagU involved in acid resistance [Paenibacillus wynnii]